MNRSGIFVLTILMLMSMIESAWAESNLNWQKLEPAQQLALQPLQSQWSGLPGKLQMHLLEAANGYAKLTPVQKKRFQIRLEKWSKLSPEQRKRAREKYLAYKAAHQNSVKKQGDVQK